MLTKILIYMITFLGGGIFLGLEIIASRVLAPYFGNSIYVWGSLISVFLLALSIGYYFGGLLADKMPSFKILALLILGASFFVLIIPVIQIPVSRIIVAWDLELRISSLIACISFFMIPSVLNGMITPFVIKLNAAKLTTIGKTVGNIYAVSTMGSVSGALLVSFYLIPSIGTRAILILSGIVLIFTSFLSFLTDKILSQQGKTLIIDARKEN